MSTNVLSVLAGLGGMLGWGSSDFLANLSSAKIGHYKTFFYSQLVGLVLVGCIAVLLAANFTFSPFFIFLMFVSGIGYALGYLFFYRGFEVGTVSVVSTVINLQNFFVVGIAFFIFQQRITGIQIPAFLLLLTGVTLTSIDFKDLQKGKVSLLAGVKETLIAAVLFGVFFWPINQYIVQRTDWIATNFITKCIAVGTVLCLSFLNKKNSLSLNTTHKSRKLLFLLVSIGVLEELAVLSVSGGLSVGNAIIINPIASALTVVTIGLAVIFLKEKISTTQRFGILATVCGIILMGLSS